MCRHPSGVTDANQGGVSLVSGLVIVIQWSDRSVIELLLFILTRG